MDGRKFRKLIDSMPDRWEIGKELSDSQLTRPFKAVKPQLAASNGLLAKAAQSVEWKRHDENDPLTGIIQREFKLTYYDVWALNNYVFHKPTLQKYLKRGYIEEQQKHLKLNIDLCKRLATLIGKGHCQINMDEWNNKQEFDPINIPCIEEPGAEEHCGTNACVAGWIIYLTPKRNRPRGLALKETAQRILGISHREAELLFFDYDLTPRMIKKKLNDAAKHGYFLKDERHFN
jgi:uncharacterized protein YerC